MLMLKDGVFLRFWEVPTRISEVLALTIDDYFGVWVHGLKSLLQFYEDINGYHPHIKFTLEHTHYSGSLSFLDTM